MIKKGLLKVLQSKHPNNLILKFSRIKSVKKNGKYEAVVQKIFKTLKPKKPIIQESKFLTQDQIEKTNERLKNDGVSILDYKLPQDDINNLLDLVYSTPAYIQSTHNLIKIERGNIPNTNPRYIWGEAELINNKVIQKLISDPLFHKIAQEYIGSTPVLTSMSIWLDPVYYDYEKARSMARHYYHCDNDSPKFMKFFIYLTDVDSKSGAHCYVKTTNKHEKTKPFTVSKRYQDNEMITAFGRENLVEMSAPAGTIIAEDTSGFHRGTDPIDSFRILLQFRFSNIDTFQRIQQKLKKVKIDNLDPQVREICSIFVE